MASIRLSQMNNKHDSEEHCNINKAWKNKFLYNINF